MDFFNQTNLDVSEANLRSIEEKFSANRTNDTDNRSLI
jgi:hypothetical protein